jgi:uncharacterized integral membrane protein (TIGR00698 family)
VIRPAAFIVLLLCCATPWVSPPIALAAGIAFALTAGNPFTAKTPRITRILLQVSVVGLGFGMQLDRVIAAGRTGFLFTAATIAAALVAGWLLGRAMHVAPGTAHLISAGTAICGGSAIAAVGPVIGATDEEMSVSLATVFVLNAVALFLFPVAGQRLGLSQAEFGMWSAIAIHDTSSVVGAAAIFGAEALEIATTVKLTRALWIVPLTLLTAAVFNKSARKLAIPWFILGFVIASLLRSTLPAPEWAWAGIVRLARTGLTITLFLIGAGLTRQSLARVGIRPLLLGIALWIIISVAGLWTVTATL